MGKSSVCSVDGCDRDVAARGWCRPHWKRWNRHGDPLAGGAPRHRNRTCSVAGCETQHDALGYCRSHYTRVQRYGDPLSEVPFQSRMPRDGECFMDLCEGEVFARGLCQAHYYRDWRYGDAGAGLPIYGSFVGMGCAHEGCGKESRRRGYCHAHYLRLLKGTLDVDFVACMDCGDLIDLMATESHGRRRRPIHISRCDSCRRPANPTTTAKLYARDGAACGICGVDVDMTLSHPDPHSPSVDHVIPLAAGGPNVADNCALSHLRCNIRKRARVGWTPAA